MQDERKYLIEIPGMEGSDVWDADRWERNKDKLLNDHSDVNVFELGAYDPEDEQEGDQFLISMEGMDGGDLWDADRWNRNKERFLAENPTATVNRVRYVDYWGGKADENRAKRSELMQPDEARNAKLAELGYYDDITGGQVDYDVNAPSTIGLKPLSSAVKENSVSGATEYLDPRVQEFFANDSAYTERQAEIARLDAEYEQNPAVIRYREWQAQQAEEQARHAEDLKQRIKADLEENVDPAKAAEGERAKYAHYGMQGRYLADIEDIEENAKKERYATALKFLEKAEFAREHAGKGTVSGVAIGAKGAAQQFGAGIGEFAHGKALDAVTQGDIEAYNEIGDILTGLEERLGSVKAENITPEILEEYLTKDEQALILAFYEYNRAMAEAQQDMSKWYKGGKIFAESVPFMLEFLATGGIFEAASGGASKLAAKGMTGALAKWLAKSGAKTAGKAVLKTGKALAGAAAGTLARTIASPGTYKRMAEASVEVDDQGHLHRGANAARAAADMYIENLSEISGGLIGKALGYVGSGVGKAASWAFSKTPFAKYGTMLANNQLMQTIGAGIKSFMPKLEALGFHGLPEEIGEEFIGNAIRDLSGLQPGAFREMFEDDNFGSMLIGFAPMTLIGAAGGVANVAIVNAQAASLGKDLRDMFSHAYDKEHVDHMMSSLDTAETPEQMQQAVKPLVSSVISAMESGMITQEQGEFEIESIYQYAGLVAQNKALLFGKKDQDRQLADAKKTELEQEFGAFWQENEGKQDVQVAKLNNGSTVFVVSAPEADGKIMTVDTQTGQKGFANTADISTEEVEGESVQNSRTMSLDQFLNTRIALERQTAEQNRMLRERQEQIDALRSEIKVGTKINLGTEGSPIILYATGSNNAGVVVMDQNGAQSTLPWEQAADALGKPIIVKTDAQISDALVAEKAAEFAERRKARANASLAAVAAEQAATEVTEAAVAENRHIPMKEDGTVNEAAFWEQDPEGYVAWNDEQNQDGGQDSLQQIAIAKMELTRLLDEQTAAQNTSNPEIRKAAKAEAARLAERIAQLDAIEQSYAQALEEEIQAVQETQATPTAEMSEQDLEQMDTQYQNIFGKTKVRAERVRIMQEYLDKLSEGSTPIRVLTKENYREVMAEAGCTEGAIKRVEKAIKKGRGVAGFASAGTAFVMADTIKSIEEARITYIHERQHILNSGNRQLIKNMAEALGSRENALVILENLVGSKAIEEYQNDSFDRLADEIICRAMEIVYTTENYSVDLQNAGASQEVIDVINNIDNGQNTTQSNLAARRRRGRDSYADGSGRENHSENGGNSEQVSGGLLGQEEAGSLGSRGRGDGSRGSGEPGEVSSDEDTPLRVVADKDLPEANLSDETKAELTEKDLVMEGGAIMSTEYADIKHETGYQTPIERNTDADDVRFSVVTMPAWKEHYMSQEEAERRVVQYLESFVERVTANELVNGVVSHGKHRYGKKESGSFAGPLRTNVEYIVTFDLDTSCPRTFQYLNFVKVIERRIGRPLTQIESIQLTEIMRMYGQQIPCVYCYSENKRQALKQYYTDYMTSRHAVISAKTEEAALAAMYGHEDGKKGESDDPKVALTPAAYKVFKNWRSNPKGTYNPTLRMLWRQYSSDRNSVLTLLDSRAASGVINVDQSDELIAKKIGTELGVSSPRALKVIEEIVAEWKWNTIESKAHDDFTPVDEDDIWVNEKALDLWRDMTSYAKSASSAKGVLRYTPYTDELKKLSQEDRDYINGMGGVRMHSSNDFRIDYVIDYFQFMADMALYKMFGHTYTKSPEFVRIFGNSGYKINMSIAAYQDENGNIRPNVDEGFDWNEAKELRRLFPNAGTMLMATSDEQLQMALDSDWIDMCIPFHRSGLPKAVWYNMRLWTDYENKQKELFYNTTEMTEQLVADGVEIPAKAKPEDIEKLYLEHFNIEVAYNKKGERIKPHFLPGPTKVDDVDIPGHNDDHQRYLDLCKKWGVKPRFQGIKVKDNTPEGNGRIVDITEHPRYMIFVKETARTDTPQTPVQFNFDQPSEALGGKTPMEYAFDELEARAMAESELAGGKVNDIYNSLNQDQFGIINQFINTVIKHKEETGEDYPLDYITPEARDWFLVQRKALEEAFRGVESIPYHRNEYDELGNLVEGVGLENARREEEERIAAEEKAAKEAAKAAKAAARKAAAEAKKAAKNTKTQGSVDLIEEAKKALEDEIMMRFIGEEGAARLDAAIEASVYMDNLNVARSMEASGKDARAIKAATGWERGADNKWRYEQEDFEFKAKPGKKKTFKLSDLIDDWALFEAYPQLRDIKVQYAKLSKGSAGDVTVDKDGNRMIRISNELYRAQNPVIVKAIKEFTAQYPDVVKRINAGRGTEEDKKILRDNLGAVMTLNEKYVDELGGKDTLAHEIQHLIQEYEGFAQGGNESQIDTTDPKVRAEVGKIRSVQKAQREIIEEYIGKAKDIFGRGKLAELGGNRAEAVRLRREYDRLLTLIKAHKQVYIELQKQLNDNYAKLGDEGYARLAGEVEARNVEARMDMTFDQRLYSLIEDTQDVATEDQIFILDNLMMNYDEMADVSFRTTEVNEEVRAEMDQIKERSQVDGTFMKAPNGKNTNLTEEQWLMVRTENFKNWFGDWENDAENASKVVDENGEPMVVYHGTASDFTMFKAGINDESYRKWKVAHFGTKEQAEDIVKIKKGNKNIMPVFLNIRKPYRVADQEDAESWAFTAQTAAGGMFANQNGDSADGLVYLNEYEGKTPADSYAVWNPNQIKSATNNSGDFSTEDNDVRFRTIEEIDADYMNAVETGDLATAERLVAEAAERWGRNSKVRDENGKLMVQYHGAGGNYGFTVFDTNPKTQNLGSHFGTKEAARSFDDKGKQTYEVYLNIVNPWVSGYEDFWTNEDQVYAAAVAELAKQLADAGNTEAAKVYDEIVAEYPMAKDDDALAEWFSLPERGDTYTGAETLHPKLRRLLVEAGYDGVKYNNWVEDPGSISWVALYPEQIKSAETITYDNEGNVIPLSERFQDDNEDVRFSVTGGVALYFDMTPQGRARMQDYFKAQEMDMHLRPDWMAEYDENARKIKMATGWEKGVDGLWRYEVDDIKIKPIMSWLFSREELTLGDIVEDGELLRLYPSLADIRIVKKQTLDDMNAWYNSGTKEMGLPFATVQDSYYRNGGRMFDMNASIMYDDILHEVQHAIQFIEGFADGGSSSYYGREAYNALAGEVEARNVVSRSRFTPEMRRQMLLATTEDTDRVDQGIVKPRRWRAGEIRFRMSNDNQEIFVSNAARAVEGIKQEKATPEQWLKMLEKNGGLKAGEDKWMGLSDWLKASDKKTLTKQEVLDFINEHMIQIEEVHYAANAEGNAEDTYVEIQRILQNKFDDYMQEYYESHDVEDDYGDEARDYAMDRLHEEFNDEFPYTIERSQSDVYLTFPYEEVEDLENWAAKVGIDFKAENPINDTRLNYTTEDLDNKREIALTVPSIESWNESDSIHFGDAGDGRAIAWIRFGETTDEKGNRVLVIDEIQSKRHQEGREKGYTEFNKPEDLDAAEAERMEADKKWQDFTDRMQEKYGERFETLWEVETYRDFMERSEIEEGAKIRDEFSDTLQRLGMLDIRDENLIPAAPFEKNWHELAMKRMLRYAAENGYDVIAWTKGDQQAERYNIGSYVSSIEMQEEYDGKRDFGFYMGDSDEALTVTVDENGTVVSAEDHLSQAEGRPLADLVGKEMAIKMMQMEEYDVLEDTDLKVGNEGMKGFYDKMLPAFMDKYGKKWGVKTTDIELDLEGGLTMHSIPVTEEMKESVMEGQVMFRTVSPEVRAREEFAKTLYAKVLQNQFNDVTLQEIDKFINDAADSKNEFRISQRLLAEVERSLHAGKRESAIDALFGRISESAVPASERTNKGGREQIARKKKELLKNWAIASGMWYDDLSQIKEIASLDVFDKGTESDVYLSSVPGYVVKVKKGKSLDRKFPPDIDDLALFNHYFPSTAYTIIGYGDFGEGISTIVMQPLVDFGEEAYLSEDERVEFMRSIGFEPLKARSAFTNGYVVASDIQRGNIVRDAAGNIRVIDADMRYHTRDLGGKHVIPPVENDWGGGPLIDNDDVSFRTSMDLDQEFGDAWRDQQNEDGRHSTQVANTKSTYEKIGNWMKEAGLEGASILDASSGLGLGTQALREMGFQVDDVEPFPSENREAPTFGSYDDIDGKYDVVISNAVLNVIPDDWRADVLHKMAAVVKDGGKIIINTRPASNISKQGVEGKTRITLDSPSEILVKRGDRIAAYQKGFTSEELADWIKSELGEGWRVEKATKKNSGISGEGTAVVIKEGDDVSFRTVGTPTEQIVAEGVNFSKKDLASLAGEIFAALPEESRRKITDRLNGNLLGLQDAIMQIPTDLAVKEEWSDEDKEIARAIAAVMTDAAGQPMTRPFTAREALWVLYDATNKATDLVSEASRALVKRNLGFDSASLELQEIIDDYVNFRTVGNDKIDAATDMYNYESSLWTERLKESWLDMNRSVESLQRAMAKGSGMEIEPWENVVLALNRLSSKSYADKKKYLRDFLIPMWDEVLKIAGNRKAGIQDVERYLMLKHGLERNNIFAKRDAREYYRTMYDLVAERMQKQSQDQKNAALADAQKALADIDAQMAVAASSQLGRLNEARKKAVHDLEIATLVIRGDEQENEKELQMYYDAIDAEIDVKYHEFREKDYGGLTSMFMDVTPVKRSDYRSEEAYQKAVLANQKPKYKTVEEMEDHAKTEIYWFEKDHDTTDLWAKINAATKEVLRHQHEAGMITDEQYEAVRGMFKYYVPLRGFADNTAEDMYSYYMDNSAGGFAKPIIAAKGRKTKAESPLGWIGSMAESAIQADNKNQAKMALYYAALRRPDLGILSLTETWFEYKGQKDAQGRKIFVPVYPPATDNALSADELRDHLDTWESDMRQKQARGEAYKGSQRVNLKGSVIFQDAKEEQEHVVRVKVAGKDYSILINGNPRAAQAINGLLNPEANKSVVEEWIGVARRALSSMLTSFSPLFWVANYQRDLLSSVMRVSESDGVKAAWQYFNNRRKAWRVASYVYKYDEGTMGDSYYEQMYKEFAENGGITGYTVLTTNKEYEKLLEDYAKSMGRPVAKAIKNVWEKFMGFGEAIEQVSRFAAYLTAREAGKSIEEAVNAAKEVSVNFNRKGSANPISIKELEKLRTKSGKPLNMIQRIAAIVLSAMPKWMKELYFFFNASVQAITSSIKLAKKSPGKAAAWAGMYFGMSIAMAVINNLLSGDDDDEEYLDLPDYLRHSTILIKVSDKYYLKWSLPQEMRPFYAWADIIVNKAMGKIPHKNAGVEMALAAMQWLPVNPFDSEDPLLSLTPDVAAPFAEIKLNQTSFGSKVYNDMPFMSEEVANEIPDFRKATSKTGKVYVDLAEFLNDVTGGDEVTSGWIDFNPAKLEHLIEGYGGGIYDFAKMMTSLPGLLLSDEPVKVKDIPFVNKVVLSVDETNMNSHTNEAFMHYKNIADNAKRVEGEYRASDKPERADAYRQEDDWRIFLLYQQYEDDFKEIKERLDAAADQAEIDLLREQQNDLREMFLNDIANNESPDAEMQMRYDIKRYESELREFLEPVTEANKERLREKKQRNWKAMNKARKQRDSLRRLPEYKMAESVKKDLKEFKEQLAVLDTMKTPAQKDSFLSRLQIDYDEIVQKLGQLDIK